MLAHPGGGGHLQKEGRRKKSKGKMLQKTRNKAERIIYSFELRNLESRQTVGEPGKENCGRKGKQMKHGCRDTAVFVRYPDRWRPPGKGSLPGQGTELREL